MKKTTLLLACLFLAGVGCQAAPQVHDLGQGLGYLQIRSVPADLPGRQDKVPEQQAWVIDLRGAKTDQSQTRTLLAWLRFHSKASAPSLVLLNADTTHMLREMIIEAQWPSLITLAPAPAGFQADILVDANAEADRKAGDAIKEGRKPVELISITQAKVRWDEEVLAKEKSNGGSGIAPPPAELERKPDPAATEAFKPGDPVLARAVQIHRSLLALQALKGPVRR